MPAKTWAAKSAAVVSELFKAGSNAWLKISVKASVMVSKMSRLPNIPLNVAKMFES